MGLRASPKSILELSVKTTVAFLRGQASELRHRCEQTEGLQVRPIGAPGRLQFYSTEDLRLHVDTDSRGGSGLGGRGRSGSALSVSKSRWDDSTAALNEGGDERESASVGM